MAEPPSPPGLGPIRPDVCRDVMPFIDSLCFSLLGCSFFSPPCSSFFFFSYSPWYICCTRCLFLSSRPFGLLFSFDFHLPGYRFLAETGLALTRLRSFFFSRHPSRSPGLEVNLYQQGTFEPSQLSVSLVFQHGSCSTSYRV
jgi:hypothetical protein